MEVENINFISRNTMRERGKGCKKYVKKISENLLKGRIY